MGKPVEVGDEWQQSGVSTADRVAISGSGNQSTTLLDSITASTEAPALSVPPVPFVTPETTGGPDIRGFKVVHESKRWQQPYQRRLVASDMLVVVAAVFSAQLLRFGVNEASFPLMGPTLGHTTFSMFLAVAWSGSLSTFNTRGIRILGAGAEEYRRVVDATLRLFGLVAIVAFVARADIARGYLAVALPLGLVALVLSRWLWRHWLVRQRLSGGYNSSVVVIGSSAAATSMSAQFEREPSAGYRVVGVCIPGHPAAPGACAGLRRGAIDMGGHLVPVLGDEDDLLDALARTGADTVAVTATEHLGPERMRILAWELEALDVDLVVAPGVMDVAGPRLTIRPVAGLPLVHVEKPQYEGASRYSKLAFDIVLAGTVLVLTAPLLLVAAAAIKLTSRGPVLYRAERVGLNGEPFPMYKLRSMVTGAEARVGALAVDNEGSGPLFKIRNDPRVTPVGKFLRRFSIDELPQMANVLMGHMSVVGPRPPLPAEVATYTGDVRRRLLVKPGITGLWQVSGRSDLSWEESVRLDLSYVENWSTVQDLLIVWRTARAVLGSDGAY